MATKVIIIGAGISGIKAAIDLSAAGIDSLILESRDRLGGRLLSIESINGPQAKFDMGASWFHDALTNPLFEKALRLGNIECYYEDGSTLSYGKDGEKISASEIDPIAEEFMIYSQLVYKQDPLKKDVSIREICDEYIEKYKMTLNANQLKYAPAVVRMWVELWHGDSWDRVSGKYCFYDADHLGRNVLVKSGYSSVLQNELDELPDNYIDENIKLNSQVTKIDYSTNKVVVTTKNGTEYTADYLISTIPISLLNLQPNDRARIEWVPQLPPPIVAVVPDIYYGSLGKVLFEFDQPYWPKDIERFHTLSTASPGNSDSIGDWDYPGIILNYQKIANVPSLLVLTQNPLSSYIENLSPSTRDEVVWSVFKPMFQSFSTVKDIPKPKRIVHTKWNNDEFVRGSYSSVRVGSSDPGLYMAALREGYQNRIRFAGAETVDGSANGCAHGGWESGKREAAKIIAAVNKSKL